MGIETYIQSNYVVGSYCAAICPLHLHLRQLLQQRGH
jgi:hypothetical protein